MKRAVEQEDNETLALMEEQEPKAGTTQPVEETPMKKSKTVETEAVELRSPGSPRRSQRSIALSSGESECVAMVGGCSEGLLIRHCWKFLTDEEAEMVCRSDSSAARSLAGRIGVGRTRHMAAGLLSLQQRVNSKEVRIS